jgi:hypothetical protein
VRILSTIVLIASFATSAAAQDTLLDRVREHVIQYYDDLQKLSWTQTVQFERSKGEGKKPEKQEAVFDQIIRRQEPNSGDSDVPFYIVDQTDLRSMNGKAAKKGQTFKDDEPRPIAPRELMILVFKGKRGEAYTFSAGEVVDLNGQKVVRIDFSLQAPPPTVKWENKLFGLAARFQIIGAPYTKGSLWVDPDTAGVLQLEMSREPFDFERLGHKWSYSGSFTARYRDMKPESLEIRSSLKGSEYPIKRQTFSFSDFKRFTGDVKITPLAEEPKE